MQPSSSTPESPDGLEAARRRWAEERARDDWDKAARRQEERRRNKAKNTPAEEELPEEKSDG